MTATVDTKGAETEGVIVGFGGVAAGLVLYLEDGVPIFDYNYFEKHTVVKGARPLADGESTVTVDFAYKGGKEELGKGADITLSVDGDEVAKGSMDATVGGRFGIDTFGIGEDSGQPVTHDYQAPFKFTGKIDKVVIEAK
jgi:arylsulfatase